MVSMTPGVVSEVAPGVRRVVAPNPGIMTGPGTNTYLLGDSRIAVIDPGPDDEVHLDRLLELAGDRLRWVLVTHTHIDHSPLAGRLRQATGSEVLGFGPAPKGTGLDAHDSAFAPDRQLADGDRVAVDDLAIDAVHTPGHASNHLCYQLAGTGLMFSGDHVMSGSTVVIAPTDGDMAAYLESLERVRHLAPRRIAPGHGDMIDDAAAVLDEYLAHRRSREAQVRAGLAHGGADGATTEQLVSAIYTDVPTQLHPIARYSVWAHLRQLGEMAEAVSEEPGDIDARWWLASQRPGSPGSRDALDAAR